jgi:thiol-disulfide isomerase/thioredoxin
MNRRKFIIKSNSYVFSAWAAWGAAALFAAAPDAEANLLPFTADSLAALRKAHAGKPFVLSFWATHCEPCRDEMAVWRAVKEKHPSLAIALVSTDAPKDAPVITSFFAKYPPGPVQKWVFADAFAERVRYSVDKSWRGELPKTYFFNAAHKPEVKSGKVEFAWVEAWLAGKAANK